MSVVLRLKNRLPLESHCLWPNVCCLGCSNCRLLQFLLVESPTSKRRRVFGRIFICRGFIRNFFEFLRIEVETRSHRVHCGLRGLWDSDRRARLYRNSRYFYTRWSETKKDKTIFYWIVSGLCASIHYGRKMTGSVFSGWKQKGIS